MAEEVQCALLQQHETQASQASYGAVEKANTEGGGDSSVRSSSDNPVDPAIVNTGKHGLTELEAGKRLEQFGSNDLPEKQDNKFLKLLKEFVQPMPIIIWIAIAVEMIDYYYAGARQALVDAGVLLVLQILNVVIGFVEEFKAGQEIAALKASLKLEAIVIRDGQAQTINASRVVPGDRVVLASGGAIPADCQIAEGEKPIQVDQAAMTGESLPVTMRVGSMVKMGSTVTRGESEAIVHHTGASTFLGKTAALINMVDDPPHFEEVLHGLLVTLVSVGLIVCAIIFVYVAFWKGQSPLDVLCFIVVLLIASIPVALRVVCTCTLALGCKELAKEKAIVARLSAVEEFAGISILCSDKTGTLTLNEMVLQDDVPIFDKTRANKEDVLKLAALATRWWEPAKDALDTLVLNAVDGLKLTHEGYQQIEYTPFDPSLKRTEAVVLKPDGEKVRVMKGAPDVVLELCEGNRQEVKSAVEGQVLNLAMRGIRSLAVASAEGDSALFFLGILTFLDPPRPDTKLTIETARQLGVEVKMITGDHRAIAVETSKVLGLGIEIENAENLPQLPFEEMRKGTNLKQYGAEFEKKDGFAQVYPEHKYLIVEALRQRGHLVGMTGDGVNDAPALKRADVGIAVSGSTSAAQAAADIVLTQPGLSTIVSALFTSRKIFQRMKNFVIYRVACTAQLLFFFFFSCLFFDPSQEDQAFTATYFTIPVVALVSITILNDGTIISVAYDNVQAGARPEKWNMSSLYWVSMAIGSIALVSSLALLSIVLHCNQHDSYWQAKLGMPELSYKQIQTVMYLKISLSDYASVFNSRCQSWMWSRAPSLVVLLSAAFAMALATVLSVYFPPGMETVPWQVAGLVWAYVGVWAFLQDVGKVFTYCILRWSGSIDEAEVIDDQFIEDFKQKAAKLAVGNVGDVGNV